MKHLRSDYDHLQDSENKIPEDEPVFLLRGQDRIAIAAVRHYARMAEDQGINPTFVDMCNQQANNMAKWLDAMPSAKLPDAPNEILVEFIDAKNTERAKEIEENAEPEREPEETPEDAEPVSQD